MILLTQESFSNDFLAKIIIISRLCKIISLVFGKKRFCLCLDHNSIIDTRFVSFHFRHSHLQERKQKSINNSTVNAGLLMDSSSRTEAGHSRNDRVQAGEAMESDEIGGEWKSVLRLLDSSFLFLILMHREGFLVPIDRYSCTRRYAVCGVCE